MYMNNTISAYSLRVYINECIFCNVARVAWGPTDDATLLHVLKNIYTHTHTTTLVSDFAVPFRLRCEAREFRIV